MNSPSPPTHPEVPDLLVACLCARWCGTCRDYQAVFEAMRTQLAGQAGLRFLWVDIEDEADRMGGLEVEDFPTLLLARGGEVRFFGPLLPHAKTLQQTIERALDGPLMRTDDSALHALLQQLSSTAA